MNSYTLDLSGNIFVLFLLILIGIALSVYTYSATNPPIQVKLKTFLIFLRSIALSILIVMLFQPILTKISGTEKKPKVAVVIDNSKSMIAKDAGNKRAKDMENIINLISNDFNEDNSLYALFDSEVKFKNQISFDSVNFSGDYTDISLALRNISKISEEENIRSILLITDGAFNFGNNPVYDAERYSKPIDVIAIGDTNEPKDVKITSIITNDIAFINNTIPVNVNIESSFFDKDSINVSIYEDNKLLETKHLILEKNQSKYSIFFKYKPEKTGTLRIKAIAKPLAEEISDENNSISKFIEVKDNKKIISIFGGYPYPDISFIKQSLQANDNYEIREFIQKTNSSFYYLPQEKDYNETDVFVLIGFPIVSTSSEIINQIQKQLKLGKSVLFVAGAETDYSKLRILEEYLPFKTASVQKREYQARALFKSEYLSDPVLKYDGKILDVNFLNNLPPVFRTELFVSPKPESKILANVIVNDIELNEPILLKRTFQNKRSFAILSYGIYRWKLMNTESEYDIFNSTINNIINWLSINEINKPIDFATNKNFYSGNEEIEFTAQVYDESLNTIDNANVKLNLKDSSGNERELILSPIGNGRYYSQIDELSSGDYTYKGEVFFNNQKIGEDNGRFSVGEINIEYQNLTMNYNLLKNITIATKGQFYFPEDASQISSILKRKDFKPYPLTIKNDYTLWNYPYILFVVILLFAIEWIIRKRKGLI